MTVKELIEALKEFDENLVVIIQTQEDNEEPFPNIRKLEFRTNYYTGTEFKSIPENQEHVVL